MSRVIALTGATGFIGSAIAHRLRPPSFRIRALVRSTPRREFLAAIDVCWIIGDLNDTESLRRLVQGADAVVHCAGAVRGASAAHFNNVNSSGVYRLVRAAGEQDPRPRFLLISSLAAREPHLSPYAASKRQGEENLAAEAGRMQWAALRPPVVYGPGDKELRHLFRLMWRGFAPVLGPDEARFSLLYVDDLAEAVMLWLTCENTVRHVFELHDGKANGYSWDTVSETIARLRGGPVRQVRIPGPLLSLLAMVNGKAARVVGYAPMLTPGKVRELRHANWVCDNTLLTRETGWVPHVGLEEGLRHTLKAYNRHSQA